ncbi:DEAD/DEAH box helicase family protein [Hymenobacter fastidiosus]|uniref:DEAD/DEAH box helicase family protein n=1 Tax=Hymenobacter fastidiosus TaxID=486264 RepID=A0ABP7SPE9_9BACT
MYQSTDLEQLRQDNPHAMHKTPFEHQRDAFEKLNALFTFSDKEHKAGILVLPTGAGKTFTSVNWICRNVLPKNVKVLWLAHTGHLLEQAYKTFESNLLQVPQRRSVNMRLVSSDPEHSNASQIDTSDDVLIITTQTAISNTEPAALDATGQPRKTAFEKFLEHSRQSGLFVVLDEAHHAPAYGCRNLLIGGNRFADGIRQKVPNSYFLGLTATPSYSDARRRGWLWDIFKDGIIHQVEKADLIRQNILALPQYVQKNTGQDIAVDDSLFDRLVRQHKDLPEDLIERLARDSGRNDYIVNDYLDNYQVYGKTIIFADRWFQCVYLKEKLMQRAKERGITLRADAVYSHVDARAGTVEERNQRNTAENTRILRQFHNNELDVLLNVRMLSEGTDVPNVNTVFITRQTTSAILLTQMIGRALRGKAAGGGADKDVANIVFFVDNWKKVINFATPEGGGREESEPRTRGGYPIEFISIGLVEDLSRQLDSGLVFADHAYLDSLPVGWYETEVLASTGEETDSFREFVVVSEKCQPKFVRFIAHIQQNLPAQWEDDSLDEAYAQQQAALWIAGFFDLSDNTSKLLDADLIKIARHYGQTKTVPPFQSFVERNKHDLDKLAGDLLEFNEFVVQDKLHATYHDSAYLWQRFYKSYDRFRTAFDSARNRIYHIRKFGSVPELNLPSSTPQTVEQRELTEDEKQQVFQRDKYTCLCCGKTYGSKRRVTLQVDHINPFRFGGETSLDNSQTLCSVCHKDKGINEINFRVHRSRLLAPKATLEMKRPSSKESVYVEEEISRIVNLFYGCKAVADIIWDHRPRSRNRYQWELILFEGNNPAWLEPHKLALIAFIRKEMNCPLLEDITIR